jgi:peptidoglycan/xylan/chitin deacetylase (PgdA/CDA1 family)
VVIRAAIFGKLVASVAPEDTAMQPRDYGPFPYVPINDRPKLTWPDDARLAVWVIPNIEFFPLTKGIPPQPGAPAGAPPSVRAWAQRDYGNRVGIWRIMDVLRKHGIRASPTLNSDICDHHPQIVRAAVELGWEVLGHNQTNSVWLDALSPEEERGTIRRTLSRIAELTGKKPLGWLGSGLAETWHTLDYLAEEGCLYVADWVNDDQPYMMDVDGKPLVSIPYSYEINDAPFIGSRNGSVDEFEKAIRRQFDTLYAEGAQSGRVMAICLHPYLIGVPHRIAGLDAALGYIRGHDRVWFATGEEIVRHWLQSGATF